MIVEILKIIFRASKEHFFPNILWSFQPGFLKNICRAFNMESLKNICRTFNVDFLKNICRAFKVDFKIMCLEFFQRRFVELLTWIFKNVCRGVFHSF